MTFTAGDVQDDDEDLFHTWIHPVLDLSHVPLDSIKNPNTEALNHYLRTTLAERDNQVLHDAAERLRAHKKTLPEHWAGARIDDLINLIHPEHDGECDA